MVDMLLVGWTYKKEKLFRNDLRRHIKKEGLSMSYVRFKSSVLPPPPLCNRVASDWGMCPNDCRCKEWPLWIEAFGMTNRCKPVTGEFADVEGVIMKGEVGQNLMYWRPGDYAWRACKWWYNGKASELHEVTFPTGQSTVVVAIKQDGN